MSITSADAEKVTCADEVPHRPGAVCPQLAGVLRPQLHDHTNRQAWTPHPFGKVEAFAQVAGGCCWHVAACVLRHAATLRPDAQAAAGRCDWLLLASGTQGQALLHALEPACAEPLFHYRPQQIGTVPAIAPPQTVKCSSSLHHAYIPTL